MWEKNDIIKAIFIVLVVLLLVYGCGNRGREEDRFRESVLDMADEGRMGLDKNGTIWFKE
jgi:ABC-type Fe3+-citrate transport system substrate-binding protein